MITHMYILALATSYSPRCYLHQVPSAMGPLTAVFGMGTGVTSPLLPPKQILFNFNQKNCPNFFELALMSE